ncbi:MAG: YSC84-related protein [Granulosicoccaceae bacterium]|jgi:lipid-binding SYLF domain-containing protein
MRRLQRTLLTLFLLFGLALFNTAQADSAKIIDAKVDDALERFKTEVGGAEKLLGIAEGTLVFPDVIKAGFGIGGEYGEGALRIKGKTVDYYSTAAASIGLQIGAQEKTVIIIFTDRRALRKFQNSDGWEAGVDGSVALIKLGAGGSIDTTNIRDPIIGFVFGNKGLMYNLTLEGSKFTRLDK